MTANNRRKAGSALIVAIIFGILLMAAVAALVRNVMTEYRSATRSYLNTAALHLAEAGIERATADIVKNEVWTTAGTVMSDKTLIVSHCPAGYAILCAANPLDVTQVIVRAVGRVHNSGGGIEAERAIEAVFTKVLGTGTGGIDMSLVTDVLTAGQSGQPNEKISQGTKVVVGSYTSDDTNRTPPTAGEVDLIGFEGGVKTTGTETVKTWDGKTVSKSLMYNPVVFGDIEVNGVRPSVCDDPTETLVQYTAEQPYDASKEGTATEQKTPNININGGGYEYPPTDINVDQRVSKYICDTQNPEGSGNSLFEQAGIGTTVGGRKVATIGEVGKKTYYEVHKLTLGPDCELRVLGDVVLVCRDDVYTDDGAILKIGAVGSCGDIISDLTRPRSARAKLTIVAKGKFHMRNTNSETCSGGGLWLPDQFTITSKYRMVTGTGAGTKEVQSNPFSTAARPSAVAKAGLSTNEYVIHAGFTGVINAPASTVKLHGSGKGLTVWGQVKAKETELTNGVRILYDPSINNTSTQAGDSLTLYSWRQIQPPSSLRAELSQ